LQSQTLALPFNRPAFVISKIEELFEELVLSIFILSDDYHIECASVSEDKVVELSVEEEEVEVLRG
jgi:hypothetical protein